jgi:hypothetical protein
MVDEPGIKDTPTTDEPGHNDTPTVDEPGTNDTPTTDEPGTKGVALVPCVSLLPTCCLFVTEEPSSVSLSTALEPFSWVSRTIDAIIVHSSYEDQLLGNMAGLFLTGTLIL